MVARSKRRKQRDRQPEAGAAAIVAAPTLDALPCALLFAGLFLLYLGSYHYPLVFDDKVINPVELETRTWACATLGNRCLTYFTFGITYYTVGLDLPWFRAINVLFHALTALALYFLLDRLFEAARLPAADLPIADDRARNRLLAFCGAALFAVHPATVYGVGYLVQRGTVMATLFSLLALTAFVQALTGGGRRWLWIAALAYGAALLSKEHAIMLPAVAVAIAILLGKTDFGTRTERLLLAGAIVIAGAVITIRLASIIGTVPEYFTRELGEIQATGERTFDPQRAYWGSAVTQAFLFFKYLLLWLVPYPGWMSVDLRAPIASGPFEWPWILAVPVFFAWGALSAWLILRRGARGLLGLAMVFPWLLFFTEFVTSRIQEPFVLYRSYLWMAGLPFALPFIARRLSARAIVIGCAVIALVFAVAMRERLATFENNLSLWDDVVRKNTDVTQIFVDRGYANRAVALLRAGRLDEALSDLEMTIKLNPRSAHAYVNRATVYRQRGDDAKALADFKRAVELDPDFAEGHSEYCAMLLKVEQLPQALTACNDALRLAPALPIARINRAVIYTRSNRMQEAIEDLSAMLKYEPDNGVALFNRAMILRQVGRTSDAETDLRAACRAGFGPACQQIKPTLLPKR